MSPKEKAILFFLKKYGILLNFEDESYREFSKRVRIEDDDTFKRWKEKVFNNPAAQIYVYGSFDFEPANNTRFSNIKKYYSAKNLLRIIEKYKQHIEDSERQRNTQRINNLEEAHKKELETFSKELLISCIRKYQSGEGLEESVIEFFERWLNNDSDRIDLEEILMKFIETYNNCAREFRKLNRINGNQN